MTNIEGRRIDASARAQAIARDVLTAYPPGIKGRFRSPYAPTAANEKPSAFARRLAVTLDGAAKNGFNKAPRTSELRWSIECATIMLGIGGPTTKLYDVLWDPKRYADICNVTRPELRARRRCRKRHGKGPCRFRHGMSVCEQKWDTYL